MKTAKMYEIELSSGKTIQEVLEEEFEHSGSQAAVARKLGIKQSTLRYWLNKLNLEQRTVLVERKGSEQ